MPLCVVALGGGRSLGKVCVLVKIGEATLLLDCGVQPGLSGAGRFPDFRVASPAGDLTAAVDAVFISSATEARCGGLPVLTELCGYEGPVFATPPTVALLAPVLGSYRATSSPRSPLYSDSDIAACVARVRGLHVAESVSIKDVTITPYYAGFVLGGAMFHLRTSTESVVYTGSFTSVADRHLSAASLPPCRPSVLICEAAGGNTVRPSRRAQEATLVRRIQACVEGGGKVLIPVSAAGRAQEVCSLLDRHWATAGLEVPMLATDEIWSANELHAAHVGSTTPSLAADARKGVPVFQFPHVQRFQRSIVFGSGAAVLLAPSAMLTGGSALDAFLEWAPDAKNLVVLCEVPAVGSVGHCVAIGDKAVKVDDASPPVAVRCDVFTAYANADGKDVVGVVETLQPAHVVLSNGTALSVQTVKQRLMDALGVASCDLPNNTKATFASDTGIPLHVSRKVLATATATPATKSTVASPTPKHSRPSSLLPAVAPRKRQRSRLQGVFVSAGGGAAALVTPEEAALAHPEGSKLPVYAVETVVKGASQAAHK